MPTYVKLIPRASSQNDDHNAQDIAFVKRMVPHHRMAVDMADKEISDGKSPDIVKLAKSIKSAQESEIKWMTDWLKARGEKPDSLM